jgi:hypothetical protein
VTKYTAATITREARVGSRPEGKACKRCTTTAIGTVATIVPTATSTGGSTLAKDASSQPKEPKINNAPIRLLGRRRHATRPAAP